MSLEMGLPQTLRQFILTHPASTATSCSSPSASSSPPPSGLVPLDARPPRVPTSIELTSGQHDSPSAVPVTDLPPLSPRFLPTSSSEMAMPASSRSGHMTQHHSNPSLFAAASPVPLRREPEEANTHQQPLATSLPSITTLTPAPREPQKRVVEARDNHVHPFYGYKKRRQTKTACVSCASRSFIQHLVLILGR